MNIDRVLAVLFYVFCVAGRNSRGGIFFSPSITKHAIKKIATEYFQLLQKNIKQNSRNSYIWSAYPKPGYYFNA